MKKKLFLLLLSSLLIVGCANTGSGAIGGTTLGAGTGALLGQAIGKNTKTTLIGAGIGAAAGAIVGTLQDGNRIQEQQLEEQQKRPVYYPSATEQPKYQY
ncbi:MAG: YMGG-like glycine zipper-containing protein [Fusobacteriaceae bacterium]